MTANKEIIILTETVRVQQIQRDDYISLTIIAKYRNAEDPRFVIQNWMRTRFTVEFLGIWEQLNNLTVSNSRRFKMSPAATHLL
jgi:hypothetical protein